VIDSVRGRLTAWYAVILALTLTVVAAGAYGLMARALNARVDDSLRATLEAAGALLAAERTEGENIRQAAASVVEELPPRDQPLVVFDGSGRVLAERPLAGGARLDTSGLLSRPDGVSLQTASSRHGPVRIAVRRLALPPDGSYVLVTGESLHAVDEELELLGQAMLITLPLALGLAVVGGWLLVSRSLRPISAMCERARQIGEGSLQERLPVANPRDELGTLALTFNELLTRLAAAFDRQRQFMAEASHELRTPVSIVQTAASMTLERRHREGEEYREALGIIADQARRLGRLVDDMFLLARADVGQYPLRPRAVDLDELMREAARAAAVLGRQRGVKVTADVPPEAPYEGDEDLLRRMVLNLLENAVAHTPEGGGVRLELSRQGGAYVVTVADSGTGIPAAEQPRVFDRFHRGEGASARTVKHPGTGAGLGLAIARWVAEAHQGRLELVRSDETGTTFTATLP